LVGTKPEKILNGVKLMFNKENNWENPFGNGKAAIRIIEILEL